MIKKSKKGVAIKAISCTAAMLMTAIALAGCSAGGKEANTDEQQTESVENTESTKNTEIAENEESAGGTETMESETTETGTQESSEMQSDVNEADDVRLRDAVTKELDCYVGAAVTSSELNNENVWDIVTTHFNAVTFGNELKPDSMFNYSNAVCPGTAEAELNGETITVPKMNFTRADMMLDKILQWNEKNPDNALKVRGHVLVWHSQTPEWFFHEDYDKTKPYVDKDTMNKRLEWYIRTMLTHYTGEDSKYKGMFYGWDVVNEAVSDATGTYRTDSENPNEPLSNDTHGNNSSWWHVYQSNEYIINAFIYANKYAPADLELYYNDYNECMANKKEGIIELIKAVQSAEGTRIDAMGMQGHYNMEWPALSDIETAIHDYADVVGNIQITEFDMKSSEGYDGSQEAKEKEYEEQAKRYGAIYQALKSASSEDGVNVTSLTFWGTADHLSWLQSRSNIGGGNTTGLPECPLLFDENYEKKPAFYAFTE